VPETNLKDQSIVTRTLLMNTFIKTIFKWWTESSNHTVIE